MKPIIEYIKKGILAAGLGAMTLLGACDEDLSQPPVPAPGGPVNEAGEVIIGDGTWQSPLTVWQVSIGTLPSGMYETWMTGYIVGWVNSSESAVLNEQTATFSVPASVKSNVLLADYPPERFAELYAAQYRISLTGSEYDGQELDVTAIARLQAEGRLPADLLTSQVTGPAQTLLREDTRWEHCVPVQLVYDTTPRPALNLGDNPTALGRQVSIYGQTNVKYFTVYAMKFTSEYEWGAQGHEVAPKIPGVFRLTDEFVADKEYLIAQDKNIVKLVVPNNDGRGYLYTSEVTISNNTISLASIANSFYFENTDDGIRIRQNDGTYFLIDATDPAMHITDNPDQPGCYFNVVPTADGRFDIVSRLNGKNLQWNAQYASFNVYAPAAGAIVPQLYVRVDK